MSLLALQLDVASEKRLRGVIRSWSHIEQSKQIAIVAAIGCMSPRATRGIMRPVLPFCGVSPGSLARLRRLAERWPTLDEHMQLAILHSISNANPKASS